MALTALALAVTGCGGGSDTATADDDAADSTKDTKALASLVIIDRDTSVRPVGTAAYRGGNEGETLSVGDSIQTSPTGFAEIAYFDGSLTRIDRSGEYTLTALTDAGGARQVKGSLVGGRAWNRVAKATSASDQFEIDTPVASATVRGTAFAIDCTTIDVCVFTIVEGIVEITPTGATPVLVTAPAQLTVRRNTTPAAPTTLDTTTLTADPWITKNTTRDTATGKAPPTTTTSTTTTTTLEPPTTTTTAAPTTAKTPATTLAPAPTPTDEPPPPPTSEPPPPTSAPTTTVPLTNVQRLGKWAFEKAGRPLAPDKYDCVGVQMRDRIIVTGNAALLREAIAWGNGEIPDMSAPIAALAPDAVAACGG